MSRAENQPLPEVDPNRYRTGRDLFAAGEAKPFPKDVGLHQIIHTGTFPTASQTNDLLDAFVAYQALTVRKTLDYRAANLGITLT